MAKFSSSLKLGELYELASCQLLASLELMILLIQKVSIIKAHMLIIIETTLPVTGVSFAIMSDI
jgi:hypothetical protein